MRRKRPPASNAKRKRRAGSREAKSKRSVGGQGLQRVEKEDQTVTDKLQTVRWKMRVTMRVVTPMQSTCMSWMVS